MTTDATSEQAAAGEETSAVEVPTQAAPPVDLAWSQSEDETIPLRPWRSAWGRAGLVVLCGIVVAVAVYAISSRVFGASPRVPAPPRATSAASSPPAVPAPATNSPAATPSAAPTIQAVPPAPDPGIRPDDQRLLAMLRRDGIPPISVSDAVAAAADVCLMVKRGDDFGYVESWMVPPHGTYTQEQAEAFLADAISAYCPHAALH